MIDQSRVGIRFNQSDRYDDNAALQHEVACALADRIGQLPLPASPSIMEIGCGTGFLTRALMARGVDGDWLVTDKAPAMVDRCKAALGNPQCCRFQVLDGEYGLDAVAGRFDLICSSLAMQWFDDLPGTLPRLRDLLAPGGHLVCNTLAAGTFASWRAAHRACGLEAGAVPYPAADALIASLAPLAPLAVETRTHLEVHPDARTFLARLKAIGASTPRDGHRPLSPGALRQVMKAFEASGAVAEYEVVTLHLQRRG